MIPGVGGLFICPSNSLMTPKLSLLGVEWEITKLGLLFNLILVIITPISVFFFWIKGEYSVFICCTNRSLKLLNGRDLYPYSLQNER